MDNLYIDFETRSPVDLPVAGHYNYAAHPHTRALLMSYALNDNPVTVWDATSLGTQAHCIYAVLQKYLRDPDVLIWAHNAGFERLILWRVLGFGPEVCPIERFRCTATMARTNNLPGNLDNCARALFNRRKHPDGARLIKLFSEPKKDGSFNAPEDNRQDWSIFKEYCRQDTELMRDIAQALRPLSAEEWEDYAVSERINDRGFMVDVPFAERAAEYRLEERKALAEQVAKYTDGQISKVQGPKLTQWVFDNGGPEVAAIMRVKKMVDGEVKEKLCFDETTRGKILALDAVREKVRKVVRTAHEASSSSCAKYKRAVELANAQDHRIRGVYVANGAFTGRYSGAKVQPQNLWRDVFEDANEVMQAVRDNCGVDWLKTEYSDIPVMNILKGCLRPTIIAPSGKTLLWADYAQIEARVLCWLADTEGSLEKLRWFEDPELDVYKQTAASILGKPVSAVTKTDRQIYGKVPELALGYGGAVGTFHSMAQNYGVDVPDGLALHIVRQWRQENSWAPKYWAELVSASSSAIRYPERAFSAGRIVYLYHDKTRILWCQLPDRRFLCYRDIGFDEEGSLTSLWASAQPKKGQKTWPRTRLWGGKLAENVTQATAASVQRYALRALSYAGYEIVGHTHDEVLIELSDSAEPALVEKDMVNTREDLTELMTNLPEWAEGLPLEVEIEHGKRYKL